jgi:hypothetical protein
MNPPRSIAGLSRRIQAIVMGPVSPNSTVCHKYLQDSLNKMHFRDDDEYETMQWITYFLSFLALDPADTDPEAPRFFGLALSAFASARFFARSLALGAAIGLKKESIRP